MNIFDEARSIDIMMKRRGLSQSETAKMLGVSQSYVANKLRLLKLDCEMQRKILEKGLSERHARTLLRLNDDESRIKLLEKICDQKLTVAEAEAAADLLVMKEYPKTLGRSRMLTVIESFILSVKKSLECVRASGAGAKYKISYEGEKLYISICINENGDF